MSLRRVVHQNMESLEDAIVFTIEGITIIGALFFIAWLLEANKQRKLRAKYPDLGKFVPLGSPHDSADAIMARAERGED